MIHIQKRPITITRRSYLPPVNGEPQVSENSFTTYGEIQDLNGEDLSFYGGLHSGSITHKMYCEYTPRIYSANEENGIDSDIVTDDNGKNYVVTKVFPHNSKFSSVRHQKVFIQYIPTKE